MKIILEYHYELFIKCSIKDALYCSSEVCFLNSYNLMIRSPNVDHEVGFTKSTGVRRIVKLSYEHQMIKESLVISKKLPLLLELFCILWQFHFDLSCTCQLS